MVVETRYSPRQSRSVSLGAAFLVNGAIIAGLISAVPNVIPKLHGDDIKLIDVFDPPVPPPIPDEQPKAQDPLVSQQPMPTAPDPIIDTPSPNRVATTDVVPLDLPPIGNAAVTGTSVTLDPPRPIPPLVAASQDARFARDFQPQYPASELRAQRDGRVSVRVLIGVDGRVKAVEQVQATSPAFFEATRRQALAKWRFRPATRGGVPEESWKVLSVRFELTNP